MKDGDRPKGENEALSLRNRLRETRKRLPPSEVEARSREIARTFSRWFSESFSPNASDVSVALSPTIGIYRVMDAAGGASFDGEADPAFIVSDPVFFGAHFAYPRILDRFSREMDFSPAIHETDWIRGPYGAWEPRAELPAVTPEELDIVIVPGVVFGENGERIGRGAGYYDRYLERAKGAVRVGYAYDFQVLAESVPQSPWDAPMDWIVTESRIIMVKKAR